MTIEIKPTVDNILSVYRAARDEQVAAGLRWYPDARTFALAISYGDLRTGAGVVAALSPQMSWQRNMVVASRAFVEGFASGNTGANNEKANRILNGEKPVEVLGKNLPKSGHKVFNFYHNICDPMSDFVTIDRHAFDVALGERTGDATRSKLSRVGVYDLFADCYRETAKLVGIPVAALQAITWIVWREAIGHAD